MKDKLSSPFTKKLLALVLPIAFQQFMSALVSASDALMLGALAQDALSAVSLASQTAFVENLFLAAMTIGLSMFASQYWGKGDILSTERVFSYTMRITLIVSAATVTARSVEALWCVLETAKRGRVKLRPRELLNCNPVIRANFWRYTAPVLGNEIVWGVGFTMYSVIMGHLGSDAVAANAIANIVKNLVACFCLGLGSGSGIMVGKSVNSTTIAGIFCAGGDSKFGFFCDAVTMWCITVPLGLLTAFLFRFPVPAVYFVVNLDEIIKLPAVYRRYKTYCWVKNLTEKETAS